MVLFFDLDDTLLDQTGAVRTAAALYWSERLDVFGDLGMEAFVQRWEALAAKFSERALRSDISWAEHRRRRVRELFAAFGRTLSNAQADQEFNRYFAHYKANWRLFADVRPALDALAGRPDFRMGVISNGEVAQQERKLDALGLRGRFSPVVVSAEVGLTKPDPGIFLHACRLASIEPARCVYVGNELDTDARAASAVGMCGVWLDRSGNFEGQTDVYVIRSLKALPKLLEQLR